jgi:hypothetical protein
VSQFKFAVLKTMPRKIFGEFVNFFSKGFNPFKIQASLTFDLFPGLLIQNPEGIGNYAKIKVAHFDVICHHAKFGYFWSSISAIFIFYKFDLV